MITAVRLVVEPPEDRYSEPMTNWMTGRLVCPILSISSFCHTVEQNKCRLDRILHPRLTCRIGRYLSFRLNTAVVIVSRHDISTVKKSTGKNDEILYRCNIFKWDCVKLTEKKPANKATTPNNTEGNFGSSESLTNTFESMTQL